MKLILFLLIFAVSQLNAANVSLIDLELSKVSNELIKQEVKLVSVISVCGTVAKTATSNLNVTSGCPKDFVNDINDFVKNANKLATINSFEKLTQCLSLTDCVCLEVRSVGTQNNLRKIEKLLKYAVDNATEIYGKGLKIFNHFERNIKVLRNNWTKELLVLTFFNRSTIVMNELGKYVQLLETAKDFLQQMKDHLIFEVAFSNCSAVNSTMATEGDKIEETLKNSEEKVLNATNIAWKKVNNSLVSASDDIKPALEGLSETFKRTSGMSDFKPNIAWPHIPDRSGSFMKVRTCQEKKESYGFSYKAAAQSKSEIQSNLDKLKNATKVTSSRKVRAITADIYEVINATNDVIILYDSYMLELNTSIAKVDAMSKSFGAEICSSTRDIFGYSLYVKTACQVRVNLDFFAAQDYCQSAGMKLYQVHTYDDFYGFHQAAFAFFGRDANGAGVYIDGYRATNGTWFAGNQRLLNPVVPTRIVSGRCLKTYQIWGSFTYEGVNCSTKMNSYCEFTKSPPPPNVLQTTLCRNITDIRNASGQYLKSACIMDYIVPNGLITSVCRMNKMTAFAIGTAEDFNGLKSFISRVYGANSNTTFYVRGYKGAAGWELSPNAPVHSSAVPTLAPGNNLVFKANRTEGRHESETYPVVCEYILPGMSEPKNTTEVGVCGTYLKYNPFSGTLNPSINGFPSGVNFKDGSVQYVGYGNSNSCITAMKIGPGFISTVSGSAGAYISCTGADIFDSTSANYLAYHKDLTWVAANQTTLQSVVGQVALNYNVAKQRYGRVLVNGYYILGRISYDTGILQYTDSTGMKTATSYEVLTCQNFPPCGTFVNFDTVNFLYGPSSNGVVGGTHLDGTQGYVGYCNNQGCYGQGRCPCRISIDSVPPGGYFECGPSLNSSSGHLYLRDHPNLYWAATSSKTVKSLASGLKTSLSYTDLYFGRINIDRYSYLGKVQTNANNAFYISYNASTLIALYTSFEVLTCAPNPVTYVVPTPTANVSICYFKKAIFDSVGTYIKSACQVLMNVNYTTGESVCRQNGMELFTMTTEDEFNGLLAAAHIRSNIGSYNTFTINAKYNSTDAKWYTFNPTMKPLYSGAYPTSSHTAGLDCLKIVAGSSGFYMAEYSYASSSSFYCEYY